MNLTEWSLRLNADDMRWLNEGIQHIPHFAAVRLLAKINAQIAQQEAEQQQVSGAQDEPG